MTYLNKLIKSINAFIRLPSVKSGQSLSDDPELEVRKLYRMAIHTDFFAKQCCHPRIMSIMRELLGNDIKLLQSMSLLKPPGNNNRAIVVYTCIYLCNWEYSLDLEFTFYSKQ